MKKTVLKIDTQTWFSTQNIRVCSAAARGLLVDLKALCLKNGGYLLVNGQPMSDDQIATLTNIPITKMRQYLQELGVTGLFQVDDTGLFFPDIVKEFQEKQGKRPVGKPKKEKPIVAEQKIIAESNVESIEQVIVPAAEKPAISAKKPLPWYRTPAGWVKKGLSQGVSMLPDEDMAAFQLRLCMRIPDGAHLDVVPPHVARAVRAEIEKHAVKPE